MDSCARLIGSVAPWRREALGPRKRPLLRFTLPRDRGKGEREGERMPRDNRRQNRSG